MNKTTTISNEFHIDYCCKGREDVKLRLLAWQDKRGIDRGETLRAFSDIFTYGKEILDSNIYALSFTQVHHYHLSVGEHTLHVALYALGLSYKLQEKGKEVNIRDIVISSLCHDLGIIGRHTKFKNDFICCYLHPVHSLKIAEKLVPDLSKEAADAIQRHMFPLLPLPPASQTGSILIKADKACTLLELKNR